jgi:hypothetical protein
MNGNDVMGSVIQDILDDTMLCSRGLDYAAYATSSPSPRLVGRVADAETSLTVVNWQHNKPLISRRLQRFAFETRTVEQQVNLWTAVLYKIYHVLQILDVEFVKTGQGENVRLVFDVDMGGFFYTRIGRHAVLFGATLDQAEVNSGRCEREMYHMVAQIEAVCTAYGV